MDLADPYGTTAMARGVQGLVTQSYFDNVSNLLGLAKPSSANQSLATVNWRPSPYQQNTTATVQTALNLASAVPGIGSVASLASAALDLGAGNYGGAAIGLAGAIPFVGSVKAVGRTAEVLLDVGRVEGAARGTYQEIRASGLTDSHHIIQNAAVRNLPGYSRDLAPSIHLPGPAFDQTTPHGIATAVQASYSGTRGTYAAERVVGYKALRRAGVGRDEARAAIEFADEYFYGLGVTPSTMTRIPGR